MAFIHEVRDGELLLASHARIDGRDIRRPPPLGLEEELRGAACAREIGGAADAGAVRSEVLGVLTEELDRALD